MFPAQSPPSSPLLPEGQTRHRLSGAFGRKHFVVAASTLSPVLTRNDTAQGIDGAAAASKVGAARVAGPSRHRSAVPTTATSASSQQPVPASSPSRPVPIVRRRSTPYDAFVAQSSASTSAGAGTGTGFVGAPSASEMPSRIGTSPHDAAASDTVGTLGLSTSASSPSSVFGSLNALEGMAGIEGRVERRGRSLRRTSSSRSRSGTPPDTRLEHRRSSSAVNSTAVAAALAVSSHGAGALSAEQAEVIGREVNKELDAAAASASSSPGAILSPPSGASAYSLLLARLPPRVDEEDNIDEDEAVPSSSPSHSSRPTSKPGPYLLPSHRLAGTLPPPSESQRRASEPSTSSDGLGDGALRYTRSRLPRLDAHSEALWRGLHRLRPRRADYVDFQPLRRRRRLRSADAPDSASQGALPVGHPATGLGAAAAAGPAGQRFCCPVVKDSSHDGGAVDDDVDADDDGAWDAARLVRTLFNVEDLELPLEAEGEWYGVLFRSRRRPASAYLSSSAVREGKALLRDDPDGESGAGSSDDGRDGVSDGAAESADGGEAGRASVAAAAERKAEKLRLRFDRALYLADRIAHEEAVHSGGLLAYFYGTPSRSTGNNVATCVWTSREDALRASALPRHARAARLATRAYEVYELARYTLVKRAGEARLHVESWSSAEAGH